MHGTHNYVTHTYTYIHALSAIVANAVKWAMVTARLEIYNLYISVKYTQLLTYIVMYVCTCVPEHTNHFHFNEGDVFWSHKCHQLNQTIYCL